MAKVKRKAGVILTDNELRKRYNSGLASEICITEDKSLWLPSRVLALNYQLGGGIPYGGILEVFGEESTGKTLLAMDFGVVCQSLGGIVCWGDAEMTFNGPWAEKNGLDLSRVYLLPEENAVEVHSDWQADIIIKARGTLLNNEPILLVTDSIGAFECMENINSSQVDSKAEMGNRAKAIYVMLRRRQKFYLKYGVCVIYINQLRKKVGASPYEDPDVTTGGGAMKFFASLRIGLTRGKQIQKEDRDKDKVGQFVYVRTKKNKVAPPRPSSKLEVYFTEDNDKGILGYAKYSGLSELLAKLKILKRKQAKWFYKGELVAKNDGAMESLLYSNDDLRKKLVSRAGINTITKTRQRIEAIMKNMYPVKIKASHEKSEE